MRKFLKIGLYLIIILILFFIVLIWITIYSFSWFAYYYLVDFVETDNNRYSLYNDNSWDSDSFLIVEQNIIFKEVEKIKISNISLISREWDKNNKFIYNFIPFNFDYKNPELDFYKNKYLTLSFDWSYYFLYDVSENKKYNDRGDEEFSWLSREEIHNEIIKIIKTQE